LPDNKIYVRTDYCITEKPFCKALIRNLTLEKRKDSFGVFYLVCLGPFGYKTEAWTTVGIVRKLKVFLKEFLFSNPDSILPIEGLIEYRLSERVFEGSFAKNKVVLSFVVAINTCFHRVYLKICTFLV
jgi:hypothetical protein